MSPSSTRARWLKIHDRAGACYVENHSSSGAMWTTQLYGSLPESCFTFFFFFFFELQLQKGKNYSSLNDFGEEEWEQQCERQFVFWYLAHSHLSPRGMNGLCVCKGMKKRTLMAAERTRAHRWCARGGHMDTGWHVYLIYSHNHPVALMIFLIFQKRKMSRSPSNVTKVTTKLLSGEGTLPGIM